MTPPAHVVGLVERFDSHREAYRSGRYNEAQVRQDFLNPFFKAMGWDVHNHQGHVDGRNEVILDDGGQWGQLRMAESHRCSAERRVLSE